MSKARPWMKVYETWFTSRSHVDMTMTELGAGLRIMSLANASPDQGGDAQYAIRADGAPYSMAALARECRMTVAQLSKAIEKFIAVDTMTRRDDGAIGFPNFIPRQLSPSALRMRRFRETNGSVTDSVTQGVTVTPQKRTRARNQRTEDRGQTASQITPLPPKGGEREWVDVAQVVDKLPWITVNGRSLLSPRDRIHRLVVNGAAADEIVRVVEGLAAAVEAGREPPGHWNAQYVFSGHYDRLRAEYGGGAAAVAANDETLTERLARLKGAQ